MVAFTSDGVLSVYTNVAAAASPTLQRQFALTQKGRRLMHGQPSWQVAIMTRWSTDTATQFVDGCFVPHCSNHFIAVAKQQLIVMDLKIFQVGYAALSAPTALAHACMHAGCL